MSMGVVSELIVGRDKDIGQAVAAFVMEKGWEAAYIIGAIGSAVGVELSNPISAELPPKVEMTGPIGPCEVLSLTGEVMKRERMDENLRAAYADKTDPLFIHLHMCCSVKGGQTFGGGLRAGRAFRSLKIYIGAIE